MYLTAATMPPVLIAQWHICTLSHNIPVHRRLYPIPAIMFDWIVTLIPGLPLLSALLLGFYLLIGRFDSEEDEKRSSGLVISTLGFSFVLACLSLILLEYGWIDRVIVVGHWLDSGDFHIAVSVLAERQTLGTAMLFSGLILLVARFSVHYLHQEPAYHRFFLVLSLFAGAMLSVALAGNLVLTMLGWEVAGVCSFLLIAYTQARPIAARHATRAFLTNRIGGIGFGLALVYITTGHLEWNAILSDFPALETHQASRLALCLLLPAMAKSALVPFTPWLARAIEGPTPSTAIFYGSVMVHTGVFLVLRLEPVFAATPYVMMLMAGVGAVTTLYAYLCGITRSDVKSSLIYATTSQVGLMFLLAGLGFWDWAWAYMAAHAVFRTVQFLNAPSLMHHTLNLPIPTPPRILAQHRPLYRESLREFRLEEFCDDLIVKPCMSLSRDCQRFDHEVVDKSMGWSNSALRELASLAQWEEERLGVRTRERQTLSGLPAWILNLLGMILHWFEEQLVLRGIGQDLPHWGRQLGHRLNRVEEMLTHPRYWLLWIILTVLVMV